jgi:signal transduction histidine kinase
MFLPASANAAEAELVQVPLTGTADVLTNIQQVLAIGNGGLHTNSRPVRLQGVVTGRLVDSRLFYLQDGEFPVSVQLRDTTTNYIPGQRLEVEGIAVSSLLLPRIRATQVRILGTARLPRPTRPDPYRMAAGEDRGRYVVVGGVVRDMIWESDTLTLLLRYGGLHFRAFAAAPPGSRFPRELIDAEIDVQGVCLHFVDPRGRVEGFSLLMPSTNQYRVTRRGATNLFERPLATIAEFQARPSDLFIRTKIAGTVLAHIFGQVLFVQDDTGVARVELLPLLPSGTGPTSLLEHEPQTQLEPGERVELIGVRYDDRSPRTLLYDAEFRRAGRAELPAAIPITPRDLRSGATAHRVVTLTGRVLGSRSQASIDHLQQTWILESGGEIIQARLDDSKPRGPAFSAGAWVRVTGVHEVAPAQQPGSGEIILRLRNTADIVAAAPPPFWLRQEYRKALPVGLAIGLAGLALLLLQRWQMRRLEHRVAERTADLSASNSQLKEEVTARERAEAEVQRALAQEKELSELKSRFVSMVSHEFRTPLGIITSSAEILEAYLDRLSTEERKSNIRDITQATCHMSRMMEEVLLLGRVEAGKMTCRPAPLDLTVFGRRLVDEMASATNNRCSIEFIVSPGLAEAQADEGLLRHIFTNLLNNATKYSPPGSVVTFQIEAQGHLAVFTVRDRGIGISEADARLLFQAFHRGRNVGDTPGTGLGMTIIKRCVELHRGKIAFESKEGEGTTFLIALPLFCVDGNGEGTTQFIRTAAIPAGFTIVPP